MSDVSVSISMPKPPKGWDYSGEYRYPEMGETCADFVKNSCVTDVCRSNMPDSKCFILVRAKPKKGDKYYTVNSLGSICGNFWDNGRTDNSAWEFGNVFKTKEQAKKASEAVQGTLTNLREEFLRGMS